MGLKGKKFKASFKNYLQLIFQASKSIETNRLIRFKIIPGIQLISDKTFSNYTHYGTTTNFLCCSMTVSPLV